MPPKTFEFISDEVLNKLHEVNGVRIMFFKIVRIRREYPALRDLHGADKAKEILADRYCIEYKQVEEYLFRRYFE